MRNKFLISIAIAIILPALLVGFVAGIEVLVNFLIWFIVGGTILISIIYFLGSSGKEMFARMNTFENGLWITSLFVRFIGIFLAICFFSTGMILYLIFGGDLKNQYGDFPTMAGFLLVILSGLFLAFFFFWVASQINKQTKIGFFVGFLISMPFAPILIGVYPVWFFIKYRHYYFMKENLTI